MASAGGAGRGGGKRDGGKGEGSLARRAWRQYLLQLQQHPLRAKMITAGCLAGVSDSVAQKLSGYQKIEKRRLLLKMLFGFAYGGPFGHFLHKILDYIFQGKKDTKTIAKKLIHTYPIFECREAFEGGDDLGKETIPFCAIELLDVLADSWLDKPSVHAFTIPSDLPQRCRLLLGDIYEPSCEGHVSEAGVDGLEGRNSSIAPTRYQIK